MQSSVMVFVAMFFFLEQSPAKSLLILVCASQVIYRLKVSGYKGIFSWVTKIKLRCHYIGLYWCSDLLLRNLYYRNNSKLICSVSCLSLHASNLLNTGSKRITVLNEKYKMYWWIIDLVWCILVKKVLMTALQMVFMMKRIHFRIFMPFTIILSNLSITESGPLNVGLDLLQCTCSLPVLNCFWFDIQSFIFLH